MRSFILVISGLIRPENEIGEGKSKWYLLLTDFQPLND
jgi:hypothetical protein